MGVSYGSQRISREARMAVMTVLDDYVSGLAVDPNDFDSIRFVAAVHTQVERVRRELRMRDIPEYKVPLSKAVVAEMDTILEQAGKMGPPVPRTPEDILASLDLPGNDR